jgi:phosphoesterase RecJ-like protein
MHLNRNGVPPREKPDTEGFIDHLLTVEGTEVEFFMLKVQPDLYKISFRSKRYVDVNEVAKAFGGGGHMRASGCYLSGNEDEVKRKILTVLGQALDPVRGPSESDG